MSLSLFCRPQAVFTTSTLTARGWTLRPIAHTKPASSRPGARRPVAGRVRDRVRALGETDETLPLRRRYARIMAQPRDFAGDESVLEQRSKLMLTVDRLAKRLARQQGLDHLLCLLNGQFGFGTGRSFARQGRPPALLPGILPR